MRSRADLDRPALLSRALQSEGDGDSGLAMGIVDHLVGIADDKAIVTADRGGLITWLSSGAERLLGWRAEELIGRRLPAGMFKRDQVRLPTQNSQARTDLWSAEPCIDVDGGTWSITAKDGRTFQLRIDVQRLVAADGRQLGFIAVATDVGEQKRSRDLVRIALRGEQDAIRRVEELDRTTNDFVETASHELRTPLTSIAGFLEILEESAEKLGPEYELLLGAMRRSCDRLVTLADDLTALTTFDATSTVPKQQAEVDLVAVVRNAARVLRSKVPARSVTFDVPDNPIQVRGNAAHLERLLLNLLFNSVKFTDAGGSIHCKLSSTPAEALLEVSDDGIGVPAAEQGALFQRFFRSSSARDRQSPGIGLGLSIADTIVKEHHGTITVESADHQGSTFSVRLPVSRGAERDLLSTSN